MSRLATIRRGYVSSSQDFRGRGRPWGIFLVSTKLDTFCYPTVQTAPCYTCCRFDTIPACDGRTDRRTDANRQTDGIAVASIALAMRALRRAVKSNEKNTKTKLLRRNAAVKKFVE